MNTLPLEKQTLINRCLVGGMSIRAKARTAGASKNTVAKLLMDAGKVYGAYHERVLRDLPCKRIQIDEIWSLDGRLPY